MGYFNNMDTFCTSILNVKYALSGLFDRYNTIKCNSLAINPTTGKLIMFRHCVREELIEKVDFQTNDFQGEPGARIVENAIYLFLGQINNVDLCFEKNPKFAFWLQTIQQSSTEGELSPILLM